MYVQYHEDVRGGLNNYQIDLIKKGFYTSVKCSLKCSTIFDFPVKNIWYPGRRSMPIFSVLKCTFVISHHSSLIRWTCIFFIWYLGIFFCLTQSTIEYLPMYLPTLFYVATGEENKQILSLHYCIVLLWTSIVCVRSCAAARTFFREIGESLHFHPFTISIPLRPFTPDSILTIFLKVVVSYWVERASTRKICS